MAMFRDCQSGGYNLEGSQANQQRLIPILKKNALNREGI